MKNNYSLCELKKQKLKNVLQKSSEIDFDFFIVNFSMRPELVFLSSLDY